MLMQITAPHFCAGLEVENDKVVRAAPILKWMTGQSPRYVRKQCQRLRWLLTILHDDGSWEFDPSHEQVAVRERLGVPVSANPNSGRNAPWVGEPADN